MVRKGLQALTPSVCAVGKAIYSIGWQSRGLGAVWAVDVHQRLNMAAYGGEEGQVAVFTPSYEADSKKRHSHTGVAGGS
jgi:hypothetical protein